MTIKNPGTGRGSPCMRGNTPFLREGVLPWVRSIQISPIRAPIGRSGGYLGDEIAKTGAHCFRKTPDCPSIAGLRGSACSKKGPNRPNWRGDSSRDGLADVEMAERGYGVPVRNTSTKVTLMISTLARHTTSPHSPTWEPPVYPMGRRQQEPDPALLGDEIAKKGAHCFRKTPDCPPIAGLRGSACSKKGPNWPNWRGDSSRNGLADVETGKHGSGDPGRDAPDFTGTGDETGGEHEGLEGEEPVMTTLFEALDPEAREELIRGDVIELVSVIVTAVPDPDRPDDRLSMKIAAEVNDDFAPGTPWIDAELARLREICAGAAGDITIPAEDALHVALNRNRKGLDGLLAGKVGGHPAAWASDPQLMAFLGTVLQDARAEVSVWWLAWTVGMDDDGKLVVDCEDSLSLPRPAVALRYPDRDSFFAADETGETRENILERMRQVNGVVGRMVRELMGGV